MGDQAVLGAKSSVALLRPVFVCPLMLFSSSFPLYPRAAPSTPAELNVLSWNRPLRNYQVCDFVA